MNETKDKDKGAVFNAPLIKIGIKRGLAER
jgi:hypothetical protein